MVLPGVDAEPLISVLPLAANSLASPDQRERKERYLWIGSIGTLLAATSADMATSWGKREGNGLLASPDGSFGLRGVAIKTGIAAAAILPELALARHRGLRRTFALGNFVEAAVFTGVSIHNAGIATPAHR